ncbi:MAG: hypothetical protein EHM48_00415 [Planctomycetaceae bacterium]|nr:MAG: hypothetical protein EHM48_00415 [Planctomycetaceae bacterium]
MKINEKQRQWLAFAIIAVVISALSIVLGVSYPVPPAPNNDVAALGTTYFKNLQITGNELVDGAANAVQLTVQGWTTQTQQVFVVENSGGTDQFTVSNAGNIVANGTSDLKGNISDSGGTLTFDDATQITGALDLLGALSDSGGTLALADDIQITGTLDLLGTLSDSGGDVILSDDLDITGYIYDGGGALQLNDDVDITGDLADSGGTLTLADNTQVTGTLDLLGTLSDSGGTLTLDDATQVTGALDLLGAVSNSTGVLNFNDSATVTGDLTVNGEGIYASTAITPSNLSTVTPAVSFYTINSSTNVTITLGTSGATVGQMLILYGDDANTVTIADTNIRTSSGAALTLGQYDVVIFIYAGGAWIEISISANS